jgi:beta-lactamase class C
MAAARAMGEGFAPLMERRLFPELGLRRTYVAVPKAEMQSYAWGYNRNGQPVRVAPGLLAAEAYGVKSNAVDMVRFLEVNMGVGPVTAKVARAVAATQVGYYRAGELTQALVWEWYRQPVEPDRLVAGNSLNMKAVPATAIDPPALPGGDVIVNKTGSTNGFGAYVAFIPGRKLGIVMLANRNYPNEARVRAAHQVLSRLAE